METKKKILIVTDIVWMIYLTILIITVIMGVGRAEGACDNPPHFTIGGSVCSDEGRECWCSEALEWDVVEEAEWYEVWRCPDGSADCTVVGNTKWRNRVVCPCDRDPDTLACLCEPEIVRPTYWIVAWDEPIPTEGVLYEYAVKACVVDGNGTEICSSELSNWVKYRGSPYWCVGGRCNEPPPFQEWIVDDTEALVVGGWQETICGPSWEESSIYAWSDSDVVTWVVPVPPGTYDVWAWWTDTNGGTCSRSENAVYRVLSNGNEVGRKVVDQANSAACPEYFESCWNYLGRFVVSGGLEIELAGVRSGYVNADAVRVRSFSP